MRNKAEEIVKYVLKNSNEFFNKEVDKANLLVKRIAKGIKKLNISEKTKRGMAAIKDYDIRNSCKDIAKALVGVKNKTINIAGGEKSMNFVSFMDAKRINIGAVAIMSFFVVAAACASNLDFGYRIVCNNKTVAITSDKETAIASCENAIKELANIKDAETDNMKVIFTVANREMFHNPEYAKNAVIAAFDGRSCAYGIYADGNLIVTVASEEEANALLDEYKKEFEKEGLLEIGFNKNVEILQMRAEKAQIKSGEAAKIALREPAGGVKIHVVEEGETLSEIAEYAGITTDNLMKLNPGVTPETLQIGAELSVSDTTPAIAVLTKEKTKETEQIAYETNSVEDRDTYKGITVVVSDGIYGEKVVDYDVYKENGVVTRKIATNENVIKEPVSKQVKIGTKARPATASKGRFINPFAAGIVTSRYGRRTRNFHQGIDLAGKTGSPVYAADGGVVTFAGWSGDYGKLIKVRHDNGSETYYAHLSSINTSVGSKVAQGALIGKVGNTGRSTGPHLHFEIRINGKSVDPGSYIGR